MSVIYVAKLAFTIQIVMVDLVELRQQNSKLPEDFVVCDSYDIAQLFFYKNSNLPRMREKAIKRSLNGKAHKICRGMTINDSINVGV